MGSEMCIRDSHGTSEYDLGGFIETAAEFDDLSDESTHTHPDVLRLDDPSAGHRGDPLDEGYAACAGVPDSGAGAGVLNDRAHVHGQAAGRNFPLRKRIDELFLGALRILCLLYTSPSPRDS